MMQKSTVLYVLFSFFILQSAVFSQVLIKVQQNEAEKIGKEKLRWTERIGDQIFMVLTEEPDVLLQKTQFHILDDDVETGSFYWLEKDFGFSGDWTSVFDAPDFHTLWHNDKTGLVRVSNPDFWKRLPESVQPRKIFFRRAKEIPVSSGSVLRKESGSYTETFVQNNVSIDSIYLTERHLSGEQPFYLNGMLDSLTTRNSSNPQIFKAQHYIESRLTNYGYPVSLDPFSLGTELYDVQFAPGQSDTGWVAGTDRIYGTTDGGNSWTMQYEGLQGSFIWSLFPLSSRKIYAAGENGKILISDDGGTTWTIRSPYSLTDLFGVYFVNSDTGWACGDNGLIMKSVDGGGIWALQNSNTSQRLYDIFFTDSANGWAVGRNGVIVHTGDGGNTWLVQSSGVSSRLYGTHFLNPDTGFVVGWDGRVLRTVTGGTNWTVMSVPLNEYYYDVDFLDSSFGMVAGWNGACLVTNDGGVTWQTAGNILNRDVNAVDILDAHTAWVTGIELLAKSENTGSSWQQRVQDVPDLYLNNVIATITGTTYPDQYYIICAHYDDMPAGSLAPGADDNGSGTAAVIEAARVMKEMHTKYSVRFVLFAGEEQGLVGSASYAANAAAASENILGVLNMDMIGYDGNGDGRMEIHAGTMTASQNVAGVMLNTLSSMGLALTADYKTSTSSRASDHASFWSAGYPAIMHIEDFEDFTPYYHTINDRLSTLRQTYFLDNAILTISSLIELAEPDSNFTGITQPLVPTDFQLSEPYPNPFNPEVTLEFQLRNSGRVRADVYDLLGRWIQNLVNERKNPGKYTIAWDGTDNYGRSVSSGVYFIRFSGDVGPAVRKVVMMK